MGLDIRPYDRERDLDAVLRIWREVGWIEEGNDRDTDGATILFDACNTEVGMLDGDAECAVAWHDGSIRFGSPTTDPDAGRGRDLGLGVIAAVTTSRIGRKQGFATAMTARAVRAAAEAGHSVATLGIFDQGFYDRLGFGSISYVNHVSFDPNTLLVDHIPYRRPVRLGPDDAAEMYALHTTRARCHGGVVLLAPQLFDAEVRFVPSPFGLGLRGDDGRLVAWVYGKANGAHGPYEMHHVAYEHPDDLLALLRVVKELGDQVTSVSMTEPPHIQLQDLLAQPFHHQRSTSRSQHEARTIAAAYVQIRIIDLAPVVDALRWPGAPVRCNLRLTDPIAEALDRADRADGASGEPADAEPTRWRGVAGDHVLTVGDPSHIEPGHDPDLPTLAASVNAFSRLWFGVRPATSLALTDDLAAPPELLADLDRAITVPPPAPAWAF